MSMQLRHLRLSVSTEKGLFGRHLVFKNGLNILRAENSSGKSTCTQAIIYALGLEAMLSAKHAVPLPHSMKDYLETDDGTKLDVLESSVTLEIENASGQSLTIQRVVKGVRDSHLVSVWHGAKISSPSIDVEAVDYFVRQAGAATRGKGYHRLLAEFLGWELPEVQKYDGEKSLLYLECIFPLMLIEQKRGWSGIQAAMPLQFQIREVRKRAIEFVLILDSHGLSQARLQIERRKLEARREWSNKVNEIRTLISAIFGRVSDLPTDPTSIWPPEPRITIWSNQVGQDPIRYEDKIAQLERDLKELEDERIPSVQQDASRLEAQLSQLTDDLSALSIAIRDAEDLLVKEAGDARQLELQIKNIEEDIVRHKDLIRLRRMGSLEKLSITEGICPTCHQKIEDTLLSQDLKLNPVSVESSVQFLEGQRDTFNVMLAEVRSSLQQQNELVNLLRANANDLREKVRTVRSSLITDARIPSAAAIERRIRLRKDIEQFRAAIEEIQLLLDELGAVSRIWAEILQREAELPKGSISKRDRQKLDLLRDSLRSQLVEYDMKSFEADEIDVSSDTYLPTYGEFDLGFDMSASDWIRMIWAYLVGLLEVARQFENNHAGFVFFDEPQQQNIKNVSFSALLKRTARCADYNQQAVVAISKLPSDLSSLGAGRYHLIEIPEKWVLQPLS